MIFCGILVNGTQVEADGKLKAGTKITGEDGLYYSVLSDGSVTCLGFKDVNTSVRNLTISNTVIVQGETYTVSSIAAYAFQNDEILTDVILPNNAEMIFYGAFAGCHNLRQVTFGKKLCKIANMSFYDCKSLEKISFTGGSVELIMKDAFKDCSSVEVSAETGSIKRVMALMYEYSSYEYNCLRLNNGIYGLTDSDSGDLYGVFLGTLSTSSTIKIPDSVIWGGYVYPIEVVADKAFKNNKKLKKVVLGSNILSINQMVFYIVQI